MSNLYAYGLLTPHQLQAIGHVAIGSARLEARLDEIISYVLKLKGHSRRDMVENKDLTPKLQIFRSLVNERLKPKRAIEKFEQMYNRHVGAVSERNAFIHGLWHGIKSATQPVAFVTHKTKRIHADRAFITADSLAEFYDELDAFFVLYGHRLRTSR